MDRDFWQRGWRENRIAFHEKDPNPLLTNNFFRLRLKPEDRVFVPLCGKSNDMAWLAAQGFRVVGIELNQGAVEEVFAQMGTNPDISDLGNLKRHRAGSIELFVGDVVDLSADTLGPVDAIYDRAALSALPAPMRVAYAAHLATITQAARQLLITVEFDQSQMAGPPFSVTGTEIHSLYGGRFGHELIASKEITGPLAKKCTGSEKAWLLEPIGPG